MKLNLMARDIVAIVTLICCTILIALDKDTLIGSLLLAIVSFYFGIETLEKRKRVNRNGRS
jgi:hypothetical protein